MATKGDPVCVANWASANRRREDVACSAYTSSFFCRPSSMLAAKPLPTLKNGMRLEISCVFLSKVDLFVVPPEKLWRRSVLLKVRENLDRLAV